MKKIIILVIILVAAIFGIQYFTKKSDPTIAAINASRDFKVPNADDISRIFIAHRNGQTVDLTKKKDVWYIDDSIKVEPSVMIGIFDVAKNLELKYEPNEATQQTALKTIAENGILIEYFDSNGEKLKSYMMGSSSDGGHGNYAIIEGQSKPMVVKLRNAPSNLRMHFWKDRRLSWYDPTYISYDYNDIKSVSINYHLNPSESFELTKENSGYNIRPLNPTVIESTTSINSKIFESFLINFEKIGAESIIGDNKNLRDSVSQTEPWHTVIIEDKNNNKQKLMFYPLISNMEKDGIINKSIDISEITRYYVIEEDGEFYISQMEVFKKILWGYSEFYDRNNNVN